MNYSLYDNQGKLIAVNSAKNRLELRSKVMASKHWPKVDRVQYGRSVYTAKQVYAELPIK
jgi:hypothetical protein